VVACTNTQDDPQYELVGGQQPDHVLHGNFCCVQCYGTYQRLELALLQQKREAKTVSPTELIRLQVLEQRVVAKQASSNLTRNNLIAEVGIDVVGEGEFVENRASQSKMTAPRRNEPFFRQNKTKSSRALSHTVVVKLLDDWLESPENVENTSRTAPG
jgi:hypothetical protein